MLYRYYIEDQEYLALVDYIEGHSVPRPWTHHKEDQAMTRDYGTVTWQGQTLRLTDDPQADNYQETIAYYGHAIDDAGNRYRVRWDITDAWASREPTEDAYEDESNACEWDRPADVLPL